MQIRLAEDSLQRLIFELTGFCQGNCCAALARD